MSTGIIGLGSPHGDDQAGWEVINQLQQQNLPEGITIEALDRPGPALIRYLEPFDSVILIDACNAGWQPGSWRALSLDDLLSCAELKGRTSHLLGVADSLALAQLTQPALPVITTYVIQLETCNLMAEPSELIRQSAVQISTDIQQHL